MLDEIRVNFNENSQNSSRLNVTQCQGRSKLFRIENLKLIVDAVVTAVIFYAINASQVVITRCEQR